jgi:cell division transport system permease protein
MEKPGAILPEGGTIGRPLRIVIAIMCYLAALALGAALSVNRLSTGWTSDLVEQITVQVTSVAGQKREAQIAAALGVLEDTPGILEARAARETEIEALLAPYLGADAPIEDLPVPHLIFVKINTAQPPDLETLTNRLSNEAPGATVDDHRKWNAQISSFAVSLSALGFGVLLLTGLATIAIVVFATRASLMANHETVEVLHSVGAQDQFIAAEFQRHFLRLGLTAGATGLVIAAATLITLSLATDTSDNFLTPSLTPTVGEALSLLLVPVVVGLVSMITARVTVLRVIGQLN